MSTDPTGPDGKAVPATVQIDPMVALDEEMWLTGQLKQRNLLLRQELERARAEIKQLAAEAAAEPAKKKVA